MSFPLILSKHRNVIAFLLLVAGWFAWFLRERLPLAVALFLAFFVLAVIVASLVERDRDAELPKLGGIEKLLLGAAFASFAASLIYRYGFDGRGDTGPATMIWVCIVYLMQLRRPHAAGKGS